ncbi:MAG: substrate-binding domain-containing protein, partial [Gammaproteobacteria bacterium]|nr:substrate-binding domain-containing protein [Gammaproteobacteria bacterium]
MAEEAHTLIVAGTGDSQELLHDLASAFNQQQTQLRVEIPNGIGSKGGIRALIAGKVTMARTARSLKPVEAAKGLKQHLFT